MGFWSKLMSSERTNSFISERDLHRTGGFLVQNKVTTFFEFKELNYDKSTSRLSFTLLEFTSRPKITRYKTINYQKYPIYEDYSVKSRVIKKFDRKIIIERFINKDIKNWEHFPISQMKPIFKVLGKTPEWFLDNVEITKLKKEIIKIKQEKYRDFDSEKKTFIPIAITRKENAHNFWLFFVFGMFTLFIPFLFYRTKKKANINILFNNDVRATNKRNQEMTNLANEKLLTEILNEKEKFDNIILAKKQKIKDLSSKRYFSTRVAQDEWLTIKEQSLYGFESVKMDKGVYIIWNKTKDKFYVGQSKNIRNRLRQHFLNGEVRNIVFARDWYEGDSFYYKYKYIATKDELDKVEKEYIEKYNCFNKGYNKTSGNT